MRILWFKRIIFTLSGIISVGLGVFVSLFFPVAPIVQFLVVLITSAILFFLVLLLLVLVASIFMTVFGIKEEFFEQ